MIAITVGGPRWETCLETYPDAIPFTGTLAPLYPPDAKREAITDTYHRLKTFAVETGMVDLVIQDDVQFRGDIPDGYGVFGRYRGRDHWCPQAFRFDRATWRRVGWDGEGQICRAWEPVIVDLPRFDLASDHLDQPPLLGRKAGCRGCGH